MIKRIDEMIEQYNKILHDIKIGKLYLSDEYICLMTLSDLEELKKLADKKKK
jgi:hypothetical protein